MSLVLRLVLCVILDRLLPISESQFSHPSSGNYNPCLRKLLGALRMLPFEKCASCNEDHTVPRPRLASLNVSFFLVPRQDGRTQHFISQSAFFGMLKMTQGNMGTA